MEKREFGTVPTRREIEEKIKNAGDYVKMDYLSACLKKSLDFDTKKFVLTRLAQVYEVRSMYNEAAKLVRISADINTTFDGKISDFMKSFDLFVKGGNFEEADISFTKALAVATERQKDDLKSKRKAAYKVKAKDYLTKDKRKNAMEAYEKLLTLNLDAGERKEAQTVLLGLYEKLGKMREYYNIKKVMSEPQSTVIKKENRKPSFSNSSSDNVDDLLGTF